MTRSCIIKCLVISFLLISCSDKNKSDKISIQWETNKAIGICIPTKFISDIPKDSVGSFLHINLKGNNTPVLGEYVMENNGIVFHPLIPFTRGLTYEIYVADKIVDQILIPSLVNNEAPQVFAVYPTNDTLPENLLKFYISFSKPMREGEAVKHIYLIKKGSDTLSNIFLDLQQELWNNDRTMLTIWLDPGRIKRGLQPNKLLGPPLQKNENYQLVINKDWLDEEGVSLAQEYRKNFFTITRDSISPDPQRWTINIPKTGSKEKLAIDFQESLDHVLAENTMQVWDVNKNYVNGTFHTNDKSDAVYFIPELAWKTGKYTLVIESRLEDLAGNNLVRLFDADISQKQKEIKDIFTRQFEINGPAK